MNPSSKQTGWDFDLQHYAVADIHYAYWSFLSAWHIQLEGRKNIGRVFAMQAVIDDDADDGFYRFMYRVWCDHHRTDEDYFLILEHLAQFINENPR